MKRIILFIFFFFVTFTNVYAEEYLRSIIVDDKPLEGFSSGKFDYQINVDSSKDTIKLAYDYDTNTYRGNGSIGDITLNYGINNLEFVLTNIATNAKVTYTINVNRTDNRSGDNSLTSLTVGNNKVVLTDANEYNISVDGKLTSIEIHATPAKDATLVDGYGERLGSNAVKLINEVTSVPIKVKAQNEKVREYTIKITKTNLLSNDATLKSLKIEDVDFEFKKDVLEYDLSVKHSVSKIKIEAIKNHEKANVEYDESVSLKNGLNTIEIKVTAEDSSVKIYKLNITREEEVSIVTDIKITGIDFEFKPKTYNYRIETTLEKLDFVVTLLDEESTFDILDNENLKNGSIVKIEAKNKDDTVTYSFRIVNKEKTIIDDRTENETKTNNDFFKNNEMIIGLSIFGIGILSTLVAVLIKRKSQIM